MHSDSNAGSMRKRPIAGYAYAIAAATLWGVAGPIAKYLFNHGVTALALAQVRMTLSFVFMMAFFLIARRDLARIRLRDIPYLAVMGTAGLAMVQLTYYTAISKIQVAAAILLQYMAPIFILVYAATFMKEKITPTKLTSLIMALIGCGLVAGIYSVDFLKLNLAGVVWGLLAALFFAFYTLYGQVGLRKYNAMTLFAYACGFGSILLWTLNPPQTLFAARYSPLTWLAFVYVAVLGTSVPFVFYFKSLEHLEASRASITSTLEPVIAGIVAFLFIGEKMGFLQMAGGILVITAIILLQRSPTPDAVHHAVSDGGPL